ncbi:aminotransferase class I/II-fold pyridoxal phosphate-dependent enzyme [Ottowia sp.]|uniref:aminotransferase class I/II-fold pyridoxal phosphate-dependent enzyme n=1 Tax=Ottowia sp. TaxID=1898956 RepID=UPI003A83501F
MQTIHGGPDAEGVARYDLSTNANPLGPYPGALRALQAADARHYPDPAYTELTVQLAAWHRVAPARMVLAASGSEFIQRISAAVALQAGQGAGRPTRVWLPPHAYGDYARAAQAVGLVPTPDAAQAALLWGCEPSSPLGQPEAGLAERVAALQPWQTLVLDLAYAPLRLQGALVLDAAAQDSVWRLFSPNKALGLTGVRAAYAVAPAQVDAALLRRVQALAPSWPLGAHGVALLQSWATLDAEDWVAASRVQLQAWKARQMALLTAAGWRVQPSETPFFVADPACRTSAEGVLDLQTDLQTQLHAWRAQGLKLRNAASFGLPGRVRMAVACPADQDAVLAVLRQPLGVGQGQNQPL